MRSNHRLGINGINIRDRPNMAKEALISIASENLLVILLS